MNQSTYDILLIGVSVVVSSFIVWLMIRAGRKKDE